MLCSQICTLKFALNHDKSLQIYLSWVTRWAKNNFLKDVKSTVVSVLDKGTFQKKILIISATTHILSVLRCIVSAKHRHTFWEKLKWLLIQCWFNVKTLNKQCFNAVCLLETSLSKTMLIIIALNKMLLYQIKVTIFFLFHRKNMLLVLIRSAILRHF